MRTDKVEGFNLSWEWTLKTHTSGYYDEIQGQNLPTSRYYYDGQMMVEDDYTVEGQYEPVVTVMRYGIGARGIDFMDKRVDDGPETKGYPIYDGHGNMIATLGRSESSPYFGVADLRSYDVWGSVRSGSTTGDPKQRYCANLGHVQDDESGLIYMRARYYEPWTGRFISEDPARDGWNWFLYAKSNPSTFIDSDGREALAIGYNIIGNLLIAIGRMYIRGLPGDADGVLKYVAERLTEYVVDQLPPAMAEAIRGLLKWYRTLKTAFRLAKGGDVFNANKAITAIAGYTIACYGMLYIIDSEQMGGGGDWFAFE